MMRLRAVSGITLAVLTLILIAVVPESFPIGPLRFVARYLLVAYVPGLVIWNRLKSGPASLVDFVLYPSLLAVLPFAWLTLAILAVGVDLRLAIWIAVLAFLAIGFWLGWSDKVRGASNEYIALGVAVALTLVLLIAPFAANSFQAVAWDAPVHASIVSRVLNGSVPPDSPMMAGQPVNYYWLYHFHAAVLSEFTHLNIYQAFAIIDIHALLLFALAAYHVAGRLTNNLVGRIAALWILVFGLNPFGWLIFLTDRSLSPDRWYSLLVPFAMVRGYSPSLGSLIHEFLDGTPFAISFAFNLMWLDAIIARANGERACALVIGGLVLASALYLHPLSALFLVTGSFAAVLVVIIIDRTSAKHERFMFAVDVGAMLLAAAVATVPYAWNILHGKTGAPLSISLDFEFIRNQAWSMVAVVGLMAALAAPAVWRAVGDRSRAGLFLIFFVTTIIIAALMTKIALDAEYKLIYLLALGMGPLIAMAWETWRRIKLTQLIFVIALAVCIPTNALTSYAFMTQPPREVREPSRIRLLQWIRERTPADAVVVEEPYWSEQKLSAADYFYFDHYWFDIAVYAGRRQLIGYISDVLEQWGYRDIPQRQELAMKLTQGEAIAAGDVSYLVSLGAPIFVVAYASAVESGRFDPALYTSLYREGGLHVYRLTLPAR
jgi:hypothetical protein